MPDYIQTKKKKFKAYRLILAVINNTVFPLLLVLPTSFIYKHVHTLKCNELRTFDILKLPIQLKKRA